MNKIPSTVEVKGRLSALSVKQLEALALASGVPFATIYKIKRGETTNPGIETVRQFLPYIGSRSVKRHNPRTEAINVSAAA